jgi:hypothetical protein
MAASVAARAPRLSTVDLPIIASPWPPAQMVAAPRRQHELEVRARTCICPDLRDPVAAAVVDHTSMDTATDSRSDRSGTHAAADSRSDDLRGAHSLAEVAPPT